MDTGPRETFGGMGYSLKRVLKTFHFATLRHQILRDFLMATGDCMDGSSAPALSTRNSQRGKALIQVTAPVRVDQKCFQDTPKGEPS
jgi:hypothetical protein